MQAKFKGVEHTPAPHPARGIYGFIFFTFCAIFLVTYGLWIVIPQDLIDTWPYQPPQKYWTAAVPIFFCTAFFLFAFFIYPSLHLLHDGKITDASAVTDRHAIPTTIATQSFRTTLKIKQNTLQGFSMKINKSSQDSSFDELVRKIPIPSASDINIEDVSKILYLNDCFEKFSMNN